MALHVVGKQRTAMFLQFFSLVIRIGTAILAIYFFPKNLVEVFAMSGAVFYMLYYLIIIKFIEIDTFKKR
jgi:hypothetical protein